MTVAHTVMCRTITRNSYALRPCALVVENTRQQAVPCDPLPNMGTNALAPPSSARHRDAAPRRSMRIRVQLDCRVESGTSHSGDWGWLNQRCGSNKSTPRAAPAAADAAHSRGLHVNSKG